MKKPRITKAVGALCLVAAALCYYFVPTQSIEHRLDLKIGETASPDGRGRPIRLDAVEVLSPGTLTDGIIIADLDGTQQIRLAKRENVSFAGKKWSIVGTGQWGGLIEDERGGPMTALALRPSPQEAWLEPLLLDADVWLRVSEDTSMYFNWFADQATADLALHNELTGIRSARWGVRDGESVNWFTSFDPGTGAILSDGRAVTLLQYEEAFAAGDVIAPAIEVGIEGNGEAGRRWVQVNQDPPDPIVLFEDTAQSPYVWVVYAWAADSGVAALYEDGVQVGSTTVGRGTVWQPESGGPALRVDRLLPKALPVLPQANKIKALRLKSDDNELWMREGEAIIVGESTVTYAQLYDGRRLRYDLAWMDESPQPFALEPDQTIATDGWIVRQTPDPPYRDNMASLLMTHVSSPPVRSTLPPVLVLIGLFILAVPEVGYRLQQRKQAHD